MPDEIRWTMLDHNELIDSYWDMIAPPVDAAGHDPQPDCPTHVWLSANGYRGLIYALRSVTP